MKVNNIYRQPNNYDNKIFINRLFDSDLNLSSFECVIKKCLLPNEYLLETHWEHFSKKRSVCFFNFFAWSSIGSFNDFELFMGPKQINVFLKNHFT